MALSSSSVPLVDLDVTIPAALYGRLLQRAWAEGTSAEAIVAKAVDRYLEGLRDSDSDIDSVIGR